MRLIGLAVILAVGLASAPLGVTGHAVERVYRLGILHAGSLVPADPVLLGNWIAELLRELGYVERQNLIVERKYAEGNFNRLPGLARELVELRVHALLAVGTSPTQAARDATATPPIVVLSNVDPVAVGLVGSLAQPGGNITGVLIAPEGTLAGKKLELLKEAVPRATRIALLVPDDPGIGLQQQVQEIRKAASLLAVELPVVVVRGGGSAGAVSCLRGRRGPAPFLCARSFFFRARGGRIESVAEH